MPAFTGARADLMRSAAAGVVAATIAALTMPTTNLVALYSMVRQAGYSGPCIQVRRSSDNAVQDIGFVNNVVDKATADSFANGSNLTITKWYDQSGNGNHLVTNAAAEQPPFTSLTEWLGIRPATFQGATNTGASGFYSKMVNGSLTGLDRQNFTVYQMVAPQVSAQNSQYWALTDPTNATVYYKVINYSQLCGQGSGGVQNAGFSPRAMLTTISTSSSASAVIMRADSQEKNNLAADTSQAIGGLVLSSTTSTFTLAADMFAFAVYSAAHSSATMQANEAILNGAFTPDRTGSNPWTKRIVYFGSSLIASAYSTLGQLAPRQGGFGRGAAGDVANWEIYNMALGGRSLSTEYNQRGGLPSLYDSTKSKNVLVIDAPSNDIASTTFASQADAEAWATDFFGTTSGARAAGGGAAQSAVTSAYVSYAKGLGYAVAVPTIIPRSAFTTGSGNFKEYARLKYNSLVTAAANISAMGYLASDRAAEPRLQTPTNTTYFYTDGTHLTNLGYGILEGIDKPVILAA